MNSRDHPESYVIDASVAVKWHLLDETDVGAADAVLKDFRAGWIELIAPAHFRVEVVSAIRRAVRLGRLPRDEARPAVEEFLSWRIETTASERRVLAAFNRSISTGCSLYDGLYVALSQATGSRLIHADAWLRNALGDRFPLALWLTDYAPAEEEQ